MLSFPSKNRVKHRNWTSINKVKISIQIIPYGIQHLYNINTVTQFSNISASGLSQEQKRKFIYFVVARRMPLLYTYSLSDETLNRGPE